MIKKILVIFPHHKLIPLLIMLQRKIITLKVVLKYLLKRTKIKKLFLVSPKLSQVKIIVFALYLIILSQNMKLVEMEIIQ